MKQVFLNNFETSVRVLFGLFSIISYVTNCKAMYEFSSGNFYIWSLIMQCNYNHGHNIFRHLMLYRIFLSPQVKRCAILSYKHGIY